MGQEFDNKELDLVKQKGFYAYECMSDFGKFQEELPRKEKFYSSLTYRKLSHKEYEHVLIVSKKFEMKTMKYYHDLFLKCDILLLADMLEKFRNNSLKNFGLCPSHYLSTPGLSWGVILKMAKIKLYIFFEKGTRHGISYISNRYSKANNKYLKFDDPRRRIETYYMECLNFFQQIDPKEFDLNKNTGNSSKRCVLEVHLEYPKEIRE